MPSSDPQYGETLCQVQGGQGPQPLCQVRLGKAYSHYAMFSQAELGAIMPSPDSLGGDVL